MNQQKINEIFPKFEDLMLFYSFYMKTTVWLCQHCLNQELRRVVIC